MFTNNVNQVYLVRPRSVFLRMGGEQIVDVTKLKATKLQASHERRCIHVVELGLESHTYQKRAVQQTDTRVEVLEFVLQLVINIREKVVV